MSADEVTYRWVEHDGERVLLAEANGQTMLVEAPHWEPGMHPRGRGGRFIEVLDALSRDAQGGGGIQPRFRQTAKPDHPTGRPRGGWGTTTQIPRLRISPTAHIKPAHSPVAHMTDTGGLPADHPAAGADDYGDTGVGEHVRMGVDAVPSYKLALDSMVRRGYARSTGKPFPGQGKFVVVQKIGPDAWTSVDGANSEDDARRKARKYPGEKEIVPNEPSTTAKWYRPPGTPMGVDARPGDYLPAYFLRPGQPVEVRAGGPGSTYREAVVTKVTENVGRKFVDVKFSDGTSESNIPSTRLQMSERTDTTFPPPMGVDAPSFQMPGGPGHTAWLETALPDMDISDIAREIENQWGPKVNYAARPYLDAMKSLTSASDSYYQDSGSSIINYFLSNATGWRGPTAKAVKAELKRRVGR